MTGRPRFNTETWTLSWRDTATGLLNVAGAIPDPADPEQFSGYWMRAEVDDSAEPARIVELAVTERTLDEAPPGSLTNRFLAAGGDPDVVPAGVTARLLRSVPIGAVHDAVNTHLAGRGEVKGRLPDPTKRSARDDAFYANWAAHYVRLAGVSSAPVAELAEKFSVTRDRVRNVLHLARQRGLLTKGTHGRAGGELTDKALDALGEE
jgi:hypothetical protein